MPEERTSKGDGEVLVWNDMNSGLSPEALQVQLLSGSLCSAERCYKKRGRASSFTSSWRQQGCHVP